MNESVFGIEPSGRVGALVRDIDLSVPLNTATVATLRDWLGRYGVLFFRDQRLSPEQHIGFARQFGQININRFFTPVEGYPEIAEVRKEPTQEGNLGGTWHSDHSYDDAPALGSVLLARITPDSGGDTHFANLELAYDALPEASKTKLMGLSAIHSSRHVFGVEAQQSGAFEGRLGSAHKATQDAVHPLVIRHPISGRQVLYFNPQFAVGIVGWEQARSDELFNELTEHVLNGDFIEPFVWQPGSIAFWDNRMTWHCAQNDYPGQRRLMHRITIEGEALIAADNADHG